MIVVDANTIAYLVFPSDLTRHAQKVRKRDREWMTPFLSTYELLSVMAQYIDGQLLPRDVALKNVRRGFVAVTFITDEPDALEIFQLHQQSQCSTYDCVYIAAARKLRCPLVTADKKLLRGFPNEAVHPANF